MEIDDCNGCKVWASLIEVFKFFNPFKQTGKTNITIDQAKETIFRLFKTDENSEREKFRKAKSEEVNILTPSSKRRKIEMKKSTSIPIEILEQIPWIFENKNDEKISLKEFNIIIISIVAYTMSSLGFLYRFQKSADEKGLFLKVYAIEDMLIRAAKDMKYRLKVKPQPDWDEAVKNFPLYSPISISKNINKKDIFLKYDENGEECKINCKIDCPHKSHFTVTDKYRIFQGHVNQKMDLSILKKLKLTNNRFVPHQELPLQDLKKEWADFCRLAAKKNTRKVRTYFSEQIAFYFCFSDELKTFVKVLAPVGLIVYMIRVINYYTYKFQEMIYIYLFYAIFLIIWSISFNKHWERKEKYLAWQWGTLDFSDQKIQREQFKGSYSIDPVTDQMKLIRKNPGKYRLIYIISQLITITSLLCCLASTYLISQIDYPDFITDKELVQGITNSIQITAYNWIYAYIAESLTSWENHETIQEHNDSFILKLFIFRFINSYSSLLYIGIIKRLRGEICSDGSCMKELEKRLGIIFISGIFFNIFEILSPLLVFYYNSGLCKRKFENLQNEELKKLEREALLVPYDYALRDYMELCIQFGYISMFGASNQFLGAYALVAAYLETRIDSLKLCKILKRPEPCKTENIGVWKKIFFFISICGVFSNLAITVFNTGLLNEINNFEKLKIFVFCEKTVLVLWFLIWLALPNCPKAVVDGKCWANRMNHEFLVKEVNAASVKSTWMARKSIVFKFGDSLGVGEARPRFLSGSDKSCGSFNDEKKFFIEISDFQY
jgi:hypothetical protein